MRIRLFIYIFCLFSFQGAIAQVDSVIRYPIDGEIKDTATFYLEKNIPYIDYQIVFYKIDTASHSYDRLFAIYRDDSLVFKEYSFGVDQMRLVELAMNESGPAYVSDLNGDKVEDLVLQVFTGGAHCCTKWYVFSLGDNFQCLTTLDAGHGYIRLAELNKDGIKEIETQDWCMAYWHSSFAECRPADIILGYQNQKWQANFDLMKKKISRTEWKKKALDIRKKLEDKLKEVKQKGNVLTEYFPSGNWNWLSNNALESQSVWDTMLQLIYQDNEKEAYLYLDWLWPKELIDLKTAFIKDFKAQMATSNFLKK